MNGYKVIGYDIDRKITKLIKSKKLKLTEPGLTSRLNEVISKNKFVASNKIEVSDIYEICLKLQKAGVIINRPPRDGRMAFVRSPDNISIELLQTGNPLEIKEPWLSMKNIGHW